MLSSAAEILEDVGVEGDGLRGELNVADGLDGAKGEGLLSFRGEGRGEEGKKDHKDEE